MRYDNVHYCRHSLLVAELINKLNALFGVELTVQNLFRYPTVAALSQLVDARKGNQEQPEVTDTDVIDLVAEVNKHDSMVVK